MWEYTSYFNTRTVITYFLFHLWWRFDILVLDEAHVVRYTWFCKKDTCFNPHFSLIFSNSLLFEIIIFEEARNNEFPLQKRWWKNNFNRSFVIWNSDWKRIDWDQFFFKLDYWIFFSLLVCIAKSSWPFFKQVAKNYPKVSIRLILTSTRLGDGDLSLLECISLLSTFFCFIKITFPMP